MSRLGALVEHVTHVAEYIEYESRPRGPVVHAWPHEGLVSLCGLVRDPSKPIRFVGSKCARCLAEATRKSFVSR